MGYLFPPCGSYRGFTGSELAQESGKNYLILTPTGDPQNKYIGCVIFEIEELETASLLKSGSMAKIIFSISGTEGSFNGAGGYTAGSVKSGIIYGQYFQNDHPQFRLFASGRTLP